jgi:phage gp16-like protein
MLDWNEEVIQRLARFERKHYKERCQQIKGIEEEGTVEEEEKEVAKMKAKQTEGGDEDGDEEDEAMDEQKRRRRGREG